MYFWEFINYVLTLSIMNRELAIASNFTFISVGNLLNICFFASVLISYRVGGKESS